MIDFIDEGSLSSSSCPSPPFATVLICVGYVAGAVCDVVVGKVKRIRGVCYTAMGSPAAGGRVVETARGILNNFIPDVYIYTDHYKKNKDAGLSVDTVPPPSSSSSSVCLCCCC